jgi:chromosome segregation ATPase
MSLDVAYLALGELEKLLSQYEEKVKGIEDTWRAFADAAAKTKSSWDADLAKVKIRADQLRNVVESLKREQEVLLAKKELGLISEKDYNALSTELQKKIDEYQAKLNELTQKVAELESRILYLWSRALTKEYLAKFDLLELEKKIEDAKAAGRIDDETYAKIRHEVTIMKQTWELLNLLPPTDKA